MSRSVHTDPPRVRGPRRARSPYAPRSTHARARRRRRLRLLKERGIVATISRATVTGAAPPIGRPRVRVARPTPGFVHAVTHSDVARALGTLGVARTYGIRTVELARRPPHGPDALPLGRFMAPGRIVLYEQPAGGWSLPSPPAGAEAGRLRRAGAVVAPPAGGGRTRVTWPGGALRRFLLEDVLAHEVAHHVIQRERRRFRYRAIRTRDHEALAALHATRWGRAGRGEREEP